MTSTFQRVTATFWDIILAVMPILIVKGWPEIFSQWLMLSGIPLLACRYYLTQLSRA